MPVKRLREYLDSKGVKYATIAHSPAYTMTEIAKAAHMPGNKLAKTVMVDMDGSLAMVVLPTPKHVDLKLLREVTGARSVRLATERQFKDKFPGCEVGAMPPFGNLYDMAVYVAPEMTECDWIAFNAGSHTELLQLAYEDFARLVKPHVMALAGGA